jgi:hypothetical protein
MTCTEDVSDQSRNDLCDLDDHEDCGLDPMVFLSFQQKKKWKARATSYVAIWN